MCRRSPGIGIRGRARTASIPSRFRATTWMGGGSIRRRARSSWLIDLGRRLLGLPRQTPPRHAAEAVPEGEAVVLAERRAGAVVALDLVDEEGRAVAAPVPARRHVPHDTHLLPRAEH